MGIETKEEKKMVKNHKYDGRISVITWIHFTYQRKTHGNIKCANVGNMHCTNSREKKSGLLETKIFTLSN